MFITKYIKDVYNGVKSLLVGMKRTLYYFTHHKEIITQQYPDNRDTLVLPERFKGEVVMPHDEKNEHRKKKKAIDKLVYHLELCTMCNLCIEACPSDAIKMAQTFEHSVFDRNELTKILNNPGSKIMDGVE